MRSARDARRPLRPVVAVLAAIAAIGVSSASASTMLVATTKNSPTHKGAVLVVDDAGQTSLYGDPTVGGSGLTSLEFDGSGRLYGTTIDGQGTASRLIEIDPGTGGLVSAIGTFADAASGAELSLGDLAYDPVSGRMLAITSAAAAPGTGGRIYEIDTGTALGSLIGEVVLHNPQHGEVGYGVAGGLSFTSDGSLWLTGYDPLVGASGTNMLFEIDPATAEEISRVELSLNDWLIHGLGTRPEDDQLFATEAGTGRIYRLDRDGTLTLHSVPSGGDSASDIAFRIMEPGSAGPLAIGILLLGYAIGRRRA